MPTSFDPDHLETLKGKTLRGTDGDLGSIEELYVDNSDGDLTFATVDTGAIAGRKSFVPLPGAKLEDDVVKVPYAQRLVETAPPVDTEAELTPEDEDRLYVHYGIRTQWADELPEPEPEAEYEPEREPEPEPEPEPVPVRRVRAAAPRPPARPVRAAAPPAPVQGDEITLSEERLRVGTQRVEAGRARVRKYVVEETETVTVPISHEEVLIERIPITDGEVGADLRGGETGEVVHEVVLMQETPYVTKETVAVEKVRVGTQTVTEHRSVTADVRREELDVDVEGDVDVR